MIKVVKVNGTQLTTKPCILSDLNADGFLLVDDEGNEEVLSLDTIREYFLDKKLKIKFEEMSRATVEE